MIVVGCTISKHICLWPRAKLHAAMEISGHIFLETPAITCVAGINSKHMCSERMLFLFRSTRTKCSVCHPTNGNDIASRKSCQGLGSAQHFRNNISQTHGSWSPRMQKENATRAWWPLRMRRSGYRKRVCGVLQLSPRTGIMNRRDRQKDKWHCQGLVALRTARS